ncbi:unnamed protein product [Meganyctiphanes norvegica]|uniref:Uncharacterized protein n=1 Tax=Meganyctiphanes norvegica TaxID=48144 RepID=A0AAV2QU78_MEGNR
MASNSASRFVYNRPQSDVTYPITPRTITRHITPTQYEYIQALIACHLTINIPPLNLYYNPFINCNLYLLSEDGVHLTPFGYKVISAVARRQITQTLQGIYPSIPMEVKPLLPIISQRILDIFRPVRFVKESSQPSSSSSSSSASSTGPPPPNPPPSSEDEVQLLTPSHFTGSIISLPLHLLKPSKMATPSSLTNSEEDLLLMSPSASNWDLSLPKPLHTHPSATTNPPQMLTAENLLLGPSTLDIPIHTSPQTSSPA